MSVARADYLSLYDEAAMTFPGCQHAEVEIRFSTIGDKTVGELPWGSHVCLFYETAQDLIDAGTGYLQPAWRRESSAFGRYRSR